MSDSFSSANAFRALGHESWLAVGTRREDDSYTFTIPNDRSRNALVRAIDHVRRNPEGLVHRLRGMGLTIVMTVETPGDPGGALSRFAMSPGDFFGLPANRVVELGGRIEI